MKILLTNDDGIHAEGLATLAGLLADRAEIVVVAPSEPLSGCSHTVTTDRPLGVQEITPGRYSVDGSPADCVRLALLHLVPQVDWVISGINAGGNLGVDIHMSGTVAAAREAALLGRAALALSQYRDRGGGFEWQRTGLVAAEVLDELLGCPPKPTHFWNVNFPDSKRSSPSPEMIQCQPDTHPLSIGYRKAGDTFEFCGVYQDRPYAAGTDVDRCFAGYVAVSMVSCGFGSST